MNIMDDIFKIAEKFYAQLHGSDTRPEEISDRNDIENVAAPAITKKEAEHALKRMSRGKAAGEEGVPADLFNDGDPILLEKIAK